MPLVSTLIDRIAIPRQLMDAKALRSRLSNGSLPLDGDFESDAALLPTNDLKSLLVQLIHILQAPGTGRHGKTAEDHGLSQYQSIGKANSEVLLLIREFGARELSQVISRLDAEPENAEENQLRWVFELPVKFQDGLRSLRFRLVQTKRQQTSATAR